MKLLLSAFLGLSLLVTNTSLAANTPPNFDPAKWAELVTRIVATGNPLETDQGEFRSLTRIIPADTSKPHQADYISTQGGYDSDGKYAPGLIYDVSESWQIRDQNWEVDQWIFTVSVDGDLLAVEHNDLVETINGNQIISDDPISTGAVNDPAELERWGKMLSQW